MKKKKAVYPKSTSEQAAKTSQRLGPLWWRYMLEATEEVIKEQNSSEVSGIAGKANLAGEISCSEENKGSFWASPGLPFYGEVLWQLLSAIIVPGPGVLSAV